MELPCWEASVEQKGSVTTTTIHLPDNKYLVCHVKSRASGEVKFLVPTKKLAEEFANLKDWDEVVSKTPMGHILSFYPDLSLLRLHATMETNGSSDLVPKMLAANLKLGGNCYLTFAFDGGNFEVTLTFPKDYTDIISRLEAKVPKTEKGNFVTFTVQTKCTPSEVGKIVSETVKWVSNKLAQGGEHVKG